MDNSDLFSSRGSQYETDMAQLKHTQGKEDQSKGFISLQDGAAPITTGLASSRSQL